MRRPNSLLLGLTLSCLYFLAYGRRLLGPNVCYHYDIGRHCCDGFIEINSFCLLKRISDSAGHSPTKTTEPHIRFASGPKEHKVVSHTSLDADGRPKGIRYANGPAESWYHPDLTGGRIEDTTKPTARPPINKDEFNKPVDMEEIRRRLRLRKKKTTPRMTSLSTTAVPIAYKETTRRVIIQQAPIEHRKWDWERNEWISIPQSQVAVERMSSNSYLRAVKLPNGRGRVYQPYGRQSDDTDTARNAFRQRELISVPANNDYQDDAAQTSGTPTTTLRTDSAQNRIYFKPIPVAKDDGSVDTKQQTNTKPSVRQNECPTGYTSVKSQSGEQVCYPLSGLTYQPQINRRLDDRSRSQVQGITCPPGHYLRSSEYGDACVPNDWQPCSDSPTCSHDQLPIVNPIQTVSCQDMAGQSLPCTNHLTGYPSRDPSGGCDDGGCDDADSLCSDGGCSQTRCTDNDCLSAQPVLQPGCTGDACAETISTGCNDGDSSSGTPCSGQVSSSGPCLNGATLTDGGICACSPGFVGGRCEHDINECTVDGGRRGPCSHQCLNTIGSYKCFCPAGSVLAEDGVSCNLVTCPKCMHGGVCDEQSRTCVCPAGFTGRICETDVNECDIPGICAHQCRNTFGSYLCLCNYGYTLQRDAHSCADYRCRPKCVNGGICARGKCLCPTGFTGIICQFNNRL